MSEKLDLGSWVNDVVQHLLDAPLVENGHAVGHRQRFGLIVGDEDEGDAELAL